MKVPFILKKILESNNFHWTEVPTRTALFFAKFGTWRYVPDRIRHTVLTCAGTQWRPNQEPEILDVLGTSGQ